MAHFTTVASLISPPQSNDGNLIKRAIHLSLRKKCLDSQRVCVVLDRVLRNALPRAVINKFIQKPSINDPIPSNLQITAIQMLFNIETRVISKRDHNLSASRW